MFKVTCSAYGIVYKVTKVRAHNVFHALRRYLSVYNHLGLCTIEVREIV